jgi:hypothetical protein
MISLNTMLILAVVFQLIGLAVLIKHRRNVAHHRSTTPTIGRDPALTEALHARLSDNAPQADWLSPHIMQTKINAWTRRNG